MNLPPSSHFIYIPIILILGVVMGFVFGARATREAFVLEQRRLDERAKKRADRKAAADSNQGDAP